MNDKPRLKYEKPISIDMGRVAPILGDTCSVGNGATDCPSGMNNSSVPVCNPSGLNADNDCRTGSGAGTFCWPMGSNAAVYCLAGDGFGAARAPASNVYEEERAEPSIVEETTPVDSGAYEYPPAPAEELPPEN